MSLKSVPGMAVYPVAVGFKGVIEIHVLFNVLFRNGARVGFNIVITFFHLLTIAFFLVKLLLIFSGCGGLSPWRCFR